eukprot:COSAG01_NODE_6021_length_3898_cov_35.243485_2_plen_213_part_00
MSTLPTATAAAIVTELRKLCQGTTCTWNEASHPATVITAGYRRRPRRRWYDYDCFDDDDDDDDDGGGGGDVGLSRQQSSGLQDRGHKALTAAAQQAHDQRQRFLATDEPRFRLRVHSAQAQQLISERRARMAVHDERRRAEQQRMMRVMHSRASFGGCRMFHPTNGRQNFAKHSPDEVVRVALANKGTELPPADLIKQLLRTEKMLRLCTRC